MENFYPVYPVILSDSRLQDHRRLHAHPDLTIHPHIHNIVPQSMHTSVADVKSPHSPTNLRTPLVNLSQEYRMYRTGGLHPVYPVILSELLVQCAYSGVIPVLFGDAAPESALPIPDRRRLPRHRTTPSDSTVHA